MPAPATKRAISLGGIEPEPYTQPLDPTKDPAYKAAFEAGMRVMRQQLEKQLNCKPELCYHTAASTGAIYLNYYSTD